MLSDDLEGRDGKSGSKAQEEEDIYIYIYTHTHIADSLQCTVETKTS